MEKQCFLGKSKRYFHLNLDKKLLLEFLFNLGLKMDFEGGIAAVQAYQSSLW